MMSREARKKKNTVLGNAARAVLRNGLRKRNDRQRRAMSAGSETLETRTLLSGTKLLDEGSTRWEMTPGPFGPPETISAQQQTLIYTGGLQTRYHAFKANDFDSDFIPFVLQEDAGPLARLTVRITPSAANGQPLMQTRKAGADGTTTLDLNSLISAEVQGTQQFKRALTVANDDTFYTSLAGLPKGQYALILSITRSIGGVWPSVWRHGGVSYTYQATVENPVPEFPVTNPTRTESDFSETGFGVINLPTVGLQGSRTTVNGYLNSYSVPSTTVDRDAIGFTLPSRGVIGSQVKISYLPGGTNPGRIQNLIEATITTKNGTVSIHPELPVNLADNREIIFSLKGYSAADGFLLELKSPTGAEGVAYSVEISHPVPAVHLGRVVSLSEGFGFGSTIEGLGKATDTTVQAVVSGMKAPLHLGDTNRVSLESWFYPKSSSGSAVIWNFRNSSSTREGYQLRQVNGKGLHLRVARDGALAEAPFDAGVANVLNPDAWNHLALTFDGRQLRLFVNGVSVLTIPENSAGFTGPTVLKNIESIELGGGALDELRIWNIARTQAEIQQGMFTKLPGTQPGLVAYWDFENVVNHRVKDLTAAGNLLIQESSWLIENPVPQIGYVEVKLDQKVTDPKGLFITYRLEGTATPGVDFLSSRFRTVSNDPSSERNGIIIPYGEKEGRIYFMASPDALAEAAESITVTLERFSFENVSWGQDYRFDGPSSQSLTITDNGAYKVGISVTDASGRTVAEGSPLHLDPVTKLGKFYFRLTSKPAADVEPILIRMDANTSIYPSTTRGGMFGVRFTADDWDKPVEITIHSFLQSGTEGSFQFSSERFDSQGRPRTNLYLQTPVTFQTTLIPPPREARPTEGDPADALASTPVVNLRLPRNVREDASRPGTISVELSAPAPVGGLFVHYTVSEASHAKRGQDYRPLPGFIYVPEGLRQAELTVFAVDDSQYEGDSEDLVITLDDTPRYDPGVDKSARLLIIEDDSPGLDAVNVSILDVATSKDLSRPINLSEGTTSDRYTIGSNSLPEVGKAGTYEVPSWTYTGGLATRLHSADSDTIPFELATTGTTSTRLKLTLTPTTALGTTTLPTVQSGGDAQQNIDLGRVLKTLLRLTGGSSGVAAQVTGSNTVEWSLAGLQAGRYLVDLSLLTVAELLPSNTDTGLALTYEYHLEFTSSPTAPFDVVTTKTDTTLSSSYSKLVTHEPITFQAARNEPGNDTIASATNLGVVSQSAQVLRQTIANGNDRDHFRFTLDSSLGRPDTLIARFSHTSQSDLRLQVLTGSGTVLLTSDEQSNNEYLDLRSLADGEYVALVTASPRGASRVSDEPYSLKLTTLNLNAEPGPNDEITTSPHLGAVHNGDRFTNFALNTVTDQDYFRFTLDTAAGRPHAVSLLHDAADGQLGMALFDAKTQVELARLSGNHTALSLTGLSDGVYAVRVFRIAPGTLNSYSLAFGTVTPLAAERNLNQIGVRLHSRPTADVAISFVSGDTTEGVISGSPLIFTPDNWDRPQFLTVTPLADLDALPNRNVTYFVTGTAVSADPFYHHRTLRLEVTNVDNGEFETPVVPDQLVDGVPAEPNLPLVSIQKLKNHTIPEGVSDDMFRVTLDRPVATGLSVGVDLRRGSATFGEDFILVPTRGVSADNTTPGFVNVHFDPGEISKNIRLSLIDDQIAELATNGNDIVRATLVDTRTIRVSRDADPGFSDAFEIENINHAGVTILKAGVPASNSLTTVTEDQAGVATEYSIRLNTKPVANVIVSVGSSDPGEGLIRKSETGIGAEVQHLVFTPTNWNIAQSVYLKGVDDYVADADVPFTLLVSTQGEDDAYRRAPRQSISAINADNDTLGVRVSNPLTTVSGRQNVFEVSLRSQPVSDVRVTMNVPDEQVEIEGARAGDPYTLTFTPANWDLPQLVRITAVDDGIVEYFHRSHIHFSVEVGRNFDGPGIADNFTAERALDLGDINGGITWTNLSLRKNSANVLQDEWFRIRIPSGGSRLDKVRLVGAGNNSLGMPNLALFSPDGRTQLRSSSNGQGSQRELSLLGIRQGIYLLQLQRAGSDRPFSLMIDDADRGYESTTIPDLPVSIKDNDLPTAEIIAGPTASEVSSTPSYFAVRLNAPTAATASDTGIKVNFMITGGRASLGDATSQLHDYSVVADHFRIDPNNPRTGTGWIRVAPGDVQANIGIVPVDDKAVEDLSLTVRNITPVADGYELSLATVQNSSSPTPKILAHSKIHIRLPDGSEIVAETRSDKTFAHGNNLPAPNTEYVVSLTANISASDFAKASPYQTRALKGRVESEELTITLLPGDGYLLPIAPDRQGSTGANRNDLDPARVNAVMTIQDDDTPGLQIIEMGHHTTLAEGEQSTYQVMLTAEPQNDVVVTMAPGVGLQMLDPESTVQRDISTTVYHLASQGIPGDLDLILNSVHETDKGLTAVFDARLSRVSMASASSDSTLTISGANGRSSSSAVYSIPGANANEVDAAGNPLTGNWHTLQSLTVSGLERSSSGSIELRLRLSGHSESRITLTPSKKTQAVSASKLVFNSTNWFLPRTVRIAALRSNNAEPGEWHKDLISYHVTSTDNNWDGLYVPDQEIHIQDTLLDVGDTLEGIRSGLGLLQDGLLGLEVPVLGNIGNLPGVLDVFEKFETPLERSMANTEELTVGKFKSVAESALQPLIDRGFLDRVEVTPAANSEEVAVVFELEKEIVLSRFDLSSDLGLDALGIDFRTSGKASAVLEFSLTLGLGWSNQFGFFLDTGNTSVHMGAKLKLEGNGATADNPDNLFNGQGSIGFLQVNFKDDVDNRTELGITFDVSLNDLDNLSTVNFFDINGDGILAESSFTHNVGKDTNHDGRIDTNASGVPQYTSQTVAEPWTGVDSRGESADFPIILANASDPILRQAAHANWNTHGGKSSTFDEAEFIRKEGVYRKKTLNGRTIVYLDSNRDGQLNISRRNVDPFTTQWSDLQDREKNSSEVWFTPSNPNLPGELRVLRTGAARTQKFFVDTNFNNRPDAFEEISTGLRKKLDKDKSNLLEGDIIQDGEGHYVQGTSIGFYDQNRNGRLDLSESFISYSFDDFQLSTEVLSEDQSEVRFLDLNRDGRRGADEPVLRVDANDVIYFDINRNSHRDATEVELSGSLSEGFITIPSSAVHGSTITLGGTKSPLGVITGGETRNVLTVDGVRFIDLDGNGELTVDGEENPLEPVAEQSTTLNFEDIGRLANKIDHISGSLFANVPDAIMNNLSTRLSRAAMNDDDRGTLTREFNKLVSEQKIVLQPGDGDRLTLSELAAFMEADRSEHSTKSAQVRAAAAELFTYEFQGNANLGLKTHTAINGSSMLPSMQFDLAVNLPLFNYGNADESNDNGMSISFNNVALDLGSFINKFVTPIVSTANDLIDPIKPLVKALNADTVLPGLLGMSGMFESDGKPGISLLEIAKKLSPGNASKIDKAIKFADHVSKLVNLIDTLHSSLSSEESLLQFGDFSLSDLRAASDDPANSAARPRSTAQRPDGSAPTRASLPNTSAAAIDQQAGQSGRFRSKYNALKSLDGFQIHLFEPSTVLSLITGESNVNLITYDIPDFEFDFRLKRKFSIWGPVAGLLEGGFNVKTDLSIGFDTSGVEAWSKTNFSPNKSYLVFDGLYLNDWNTSGVDKDELTVKAFIGAGVGLDIGIANGFVKGGVEGTIGLDFVDVGEQSGTSDGRIRGSDIVQKLSTNPADLFDLHGVINAYLAAEINVDFFFYSATVYEKRLATIELARFKLNSNGSRGTSTSGNVQTGPIAGSTVWFDVNNNLIHDPGEPTTRTDARGHYELNIPDRFRHSNGVIRTEGGVDASTGLKETDNLALPADAHGNITAFTALEEALIQEPVSTAVFDFNHDGSVNRTDRTAYLALRNSQPTNESLDVNHDGSINDLDLRFLNQVLANASENKHLPVGYAHSVVKAAFDIDPEINLTTFAHFDEAMAGNENAKPVLIAENTLNSVVTEIEGLLAGLSGQSSDDLHYSGIFSEAAFIAIARQLMRSKPGKFDLGNRSQLRAIILEAALLAEEMITSHSFTISVDRRRLGAIIDDVVLVIAATVTEERQLAGRAHSPAELARLITEWKVYANGTVSHDLHETAIGHMTGRQLVDADGHPDTTTRDKILHIPLPPLFAVIPDQTINQNDFLTNVPVNLTRQNVAPGIILLVTNNSNKRLFPDGSISVTELGNGRFHLGFYPAEDQAGVARITLRGIDTAGGFVDQVIQVTVMPAVEAPSQGITLTDQGLLTILGSAENDSVVVRQKGTELSVSYRNQQQSMTKVLPVRNVQHVEVRLGSGNDNARLTSDVRVPVVIFGGDGHDRISAGGGTSVIFGGNGNDVLRGGSARDIIVGDAGNDTLYGNSGDDRLLGGDGNDWLFGGDGRDDLLGGNGNDRIFGGTGNDRVRGESGNDHLDGGAGNDQLHGNSGNDWINGREGNDLVIGGTGRDTIKGASGNDLLVAGNFRLQDDVAAMQAVFAEWTSRRSHAVRVANLRRGVGLNNQFRLSTTTVADDSGDRDRVFGGSDIDWFFTSAADVVVDFNARVGESQDKF